MFSVIITNQAGERSVKKLDKPDVSIGRDRSNDVVLVRGNVSKVHAHLLHNRGSFVVVDNKSTNGTFVNGERIESPHVLNDNDKIFIGDFVLEVSQDDSTGDVVAAKVSAKSPPAASAKKSRPFGLKSPSNQHVSQSPVAVNWDDDWNESESEEQWPDDDDFTDDNTEEPETDPDRDDLAAGVDDDLDFVAPVLATGSESSDFDNDFKNSNVSNKSSKKSRSRSFTAAGYSPSETIANCLREYIELDAQYRLKAIGGNCNCGDCLLCRARKALEDFDANQQ